MSKSITQVALDLYKPPFSFQYGYIFDGEGKTVADNCCENDGSVTSSKDSSLLLQVRGWGRIGNLKTAYDNGDIQDEVGRLIAQALTEFWEKNGDSHD